MVAWVIIPVQWYDIAPEKIIGKIMHIVEVTLTTGPQYRQSVEQLCNIYRKQASPFIIIHCYDYHGCTPLHERIRAMLKSWRVLNGSMWQKKIIFVDKRDRDTSFLTRWIHKVLPISYDQYHVDTLEEARQLANDIISHPIGNPRKQ